MKRSPLKNRYKKKNKKTENTKTGIYIKKQRDFWVSHLRKTKRNYFKITDNKKFWKTIWPFFSDKLYNQNKIIIIEKDCIIINKQKSTPVNNYLINITKYLDLQPSSVSHTHDTDEMTKHFGDHISVHKIREAYSEVLQEYIYIFKTVPWTK